MPELVTCFGGVAVAYDDDVLAPRLWTLAQSRWAVELLRRLPGGPVLELCSGAGQIGLVVARATGRALVQVDADERACAFARRNAAGAGVEADVRCGRLGAALAPGERFPLVLADPPYVPSHQTSGHPGDPSHAIDGGDDGLDLARVCLRVAGAHLTTGGRLILQLRGPGQAVTLSDEIPRHGLVPVEHRDHPPDGTLLLLRPA